MEDITGIGLAFTRATLLSKGWFLLDRLGEGGGGTTYRCARVDVLKKVQQHLQQAIGPIGATREAMFEATVGMIRNVAGVVAAESDLFGVFKKSKKGDERFAREIRALKGHEHPNIMKVLEVDEAANPVWYIMEYFGRGTVQDNATRYKGNVVEVLRGARDVANALCAVHEKKLVHRDIKPENVFVGSDGRWVLGDFGVAFDPDEARLTETDEAPPVNKHYRPDWAKDRGLGEIPGAKDDIYALALMIYAVLAGCAKNPPAASQLDRSDKHLIVALMGDKRADAVMNFVREHVALHEHEIKCESARDFLRHLDELTVWLNQTVHEEQILSWLWTYSAGALPPNSIAELQNLRVRLPAGACKLRCAVRVVGQEVMSGEIHVSLRRGPIPPDWRAEWSNPDWVDAWEQDALAAAARSIAPSRNTPAGWFDFEMPIKAQTHEGRTRADWYLFSVDRLELAGAGKVTGLMLYVDYRA